MKNESPSSKDIVLLRKETNMGILEVKKALVESSGNYDKALQILRSKGASIASKKLDRDAKDGVVAIKTNKDSYCAIKLSCETDFVSQNPQFIDLAKKISVSVLENKPNSTELALDLKCDDRCSIKEKINETIAFIKEKIELSEIKLFTSNENQVFNFYIHRKVDDGVGRILSTCVLDIKDGSLNDKIKSELESISKSISMHIACSAPRYLSVNDISKDIVEKETEIAKASLQNDEKSKNKPQNVLDNIVKGKVSKSLKSFCLLDQAYTMDQSKTVGEFVESKSKELGIDISISKFDNVYI